MSLQINGPVNLRIILLYKKPKRNSKKWWLIYNENAGKALMKEISNIKEEEYLTPKYWKNGYSHISSNYLS